MAGEPIFMTWPEARPHAATPTLAQALDAEAQNRHEDFLRRRATLGKSGHAARAFNGPPADPLAAAAVFEMADSPADTAGVVGAIAGQQRFEPLLRGVDDPACLAHSTRVERCELRFSSAGHCLGHS
ncbi:hypothetical protein [Streptomyces sp. NBC_00147]|uniref:hypothetical protein n=1 Tax=Streptomyces sp. NBC_00147 TaxID=2975667 RepID=UPI002F90900D